MEASLADIYLNILTYYFHRLREIILLNIETGSEAIFDTEIEVDESYFDRKREKNWGIFLLNSQKQIL